MENNQEQAGLNPAPQPTKNGKVNKALSIIGIVLAAAGLLYMWTGINNMTGRTGSLESDMQKQKDSITYANKLAKTANDSVNNQRKELNAIWAGNKNLVTRGEFDDLTKKVDNQASIVGKMAKQMSGITLFLQQKYGFPIDSSGTGHAKKGKAPKKPAALPQEPAVKENPPEQKPEQKVETPPVKVQEQPPVKKPVVDTPAEKPAVKNSAPPQNADTSGPEDPQKNNGLKHPNYEKGKKNKGGQHKIFGIF